MVGIDVLALKSSLLFKQVVFEVARSFKFMAINDEIMISCFVVV